MIDKVLKKDLSICIDVIRYLGLIRQYGGFGNISLDVNSGSVVYSKWTVGEQRKNQ